jgi:hypothetical protein
VSPEFIISNWLTELGEVDSHAAVVEARTAINMLFDVLGQTLPARLIQ